MTNKIKTIGLMIVLSLLAFIGLLGAVSLFI